MCGIIFLSILTEMCSNPVERTIFNGKEMLVCHTTRIGSRIQPIYLSELVDSVEFVKLETNEACLLKSGSITLSQHYIGIRSLDMPPASFKLFTRQGAFMGDIGAVGKGPNEYSQLSDAQMDERRGCIYFVPFMFARDLLVFDFKGNYITKKPLLFRNLDKPKFYVSSDTVTCFSIPIHNKSGLAFTLTENGLTNHVKAKEYMLTNTYDHEIFVNTFDFNIYSFFITMVDTLYHYNKSDGSFIPVFHASMPHPRIHIYKELPSYYLLEYLDRDGEMIAVRKDGEKAFRCELINDFLDNMEVPHLWLKDNYIVIEYQPYLLLDQSRQRKDNINLQKLTQGMKIDDNPVIFIGRLKH